jgi:formate/nitrite transporter FocA (FNT family)
LTGERIDVEDQKFPYWVLSIAAAILAAVATLLDAVVRILQNPEENLASIASYSLGFFIFLFLLVNLVSVVIFALVIRFSPKNRD